MHDVWTCDAIEANQPSEQESGTPLPQEAAVNRSHRLLRSAIAAAAAVAAGVLTRSMVKAVSAPETETMVPLRLLVRVILTE
ncbi:hypothetical protein [Geodermatophilus bullaregiensis]|uniref:hypothetical protein n=1 Tax=Geodermatophilus bullaregiensis TaxID=1564160 RepID=UPI001957F250|nr:hypothetical protein [Geodermatophilus bullaregiensis]